jgi:hypothetical protein
MAGADHRSRRRQGAAAIFRSEGWHRSANLAAKRKLLALNNKAWVLRGDLNVTRSCSRN